MAEILVKNLLFSLGSACVLAFCPGMIARAQNLSGTEQAPASPAKVLEQLERQRRDLDALNRRSSECVMRNGTPETSSVHPGGETPQQATCAP